ncbi:MAG: hypothetical protein JJE29_01635 [Peptostreptococcaceae bacterium]|nr:hypothetical protein [Peptostreptococcaceae bacterium]
MKIVKIPIEMIACFSEKGIPYPLKFKMSEDSDHPPIIIKVDIIIHRESEKMAGNAMYIFRCQSLIDDELRVYELKYELSTCKWFLYKM